MKANNTTDRLKGKFPMGRNIKVPNNPIVQMAQKQREEKEATELAERLKETHLAKQREINDKLERLVMKPMNSRIIIMPYPANPYVQAITESGIYIEPNANFFNPDTGEIDQAEELVACAKVMEVSEDGKYVEVGDDVYYDSRFAHPLPFMGLGYKVLPLSAIIAYIRENKELINESQDEIENTNE